MDDFKSNLQIEPLVNYNKEFESEDLNEADVDKDVYLYKITIFGNKHYIAMGNRQTHDDNDSIVYYVAYLVHEKKVVSKIGLYEYLKDDLGDRDPDFSDGELLINPKYYKQPFILNTFKLSEDELSENKVNGDKTKEAYILMEDGTLNLVETDDPRRYELLKSISISEPNVETRTHLKNTLLKDIKLFATHCLKPQIQGSDNIDNKIKELKRLTLMVVNKKPVYGYEKMLNSGKEYQLTELLLLSLEIVLNIKFLVLDENMKLNSLNIVENYLFSDYLAIIDKEISEYNKDEKSLERKQFMISSLSNYNPEKIIFLQKKDNKYSLLSHDEKAIIHIADLDNKVLGLLKFLYAKDDHLYKFDSQLLSLKGLFDSVEIPDAFTEEEKPREEGSAEEEQPEEEQPEEVEEEQGEAEEKEEEVEVEEVDEEQGEAEEKEEEVEAEKVEEQDVAVRNQSRPPIIPPNNKEKTQSKTKKMSMSAKIKEAKRKLQEESSVPPPPPSKPKKSMSEKNKESKRKQAEKSR